MEWKAWRGKSEDPWGAISHHFKMAPVQRNLYLFSRGKWAISPICQWNGKVVEWISSCQCFKRQANNKVIQTHFTACVRLHSLMPWVNPTCDVQSPVPVYWRYIPRQHPTATTSWVESYMWCTKPCPCVLKVHTQTTSHRNHFLKSQQM